MYCAPGCSLPRSGTLCRLQCEVITEPVQKCRNRNIHWQAEERHWCLRNGNALRQLATMLRHPWEKICRFLYQLTLKRFGEILNPKCSQWNWYRVPLVRPDTCGLYDGIFDKDGNLRNPLHPYILHILLTILDHYLDIPCYGYNGIHYGSALDEIVHGRSQGKCTDIFKADKDGIGAKLRQDWDASGLGYNFGGSDFNPDGDGKDGKDGKKDKDKGDDDDDGDGGKDGDDDGKGGKGKNGDRQSIQDISNLYARVVQKKHKRQLVHSVVEEKQVDFDDGASTKKSKKPKPVKKKKYAGTERLFLGEMMPVLAHEPFDETKPWTWIRRHPKQTRVLEGTHLGRSKVHRYKGEHLNLQYQIAQERSSVRSIYSVGSEESIHWTDTFGKRSYMFKRKTMARPYDYKKLLEKPDDGMLRISVAPKPTKPPAKTKGNPKSK